MNMLEGIGAAVGGAVVRYGLNTAAVAVAADGVQTGSDTQALIGALVSLASVAWSIWQKIAVNRTTGP